MAVVSLMPRKSVNLGTITAIELRRMARKIGIEGGVILHQVTPWIPWYDRPSEKRKVFANVFTMLGVVDGSGVNRLDETIEYACSNMDHNTIRLPADTPQSLRYLLFGSSYKFDSSDLDIVVNQPKNLRLRHPGCGSLGALVPLR